MGKIKNNKGLTLIELILVVAIAGIVIQISHSLLFAGTKGFESGRDEGLTQEDFRIIREVLVKELRYVAYLDTQEPDLDKYYSLELKVNDNESYSFLKKEYGGFTENNETIFPVEFKDMEITSSDGEINITIYPLEGNRDNKFDFTILLENYLEFNKQIEFPKAEKIFYACPEDIFN